MLSKHFGTSLLLSCLIALLLPFSSAKADTYYEYSSSKSITMTVGDIKTLNPSRDDPNKDVVGSVTYWDYLVRAYEGDFGVIPNGLKEKSKSTATVSGNWEGKTVKIPIELVIEAEESGTYTITHSMLADSKDVEFFTGLNRDKPIGKFWVKFTYTITVKEPVKPTDVYFDPASHEIALDSTLTLTPILVPQNAKTIYTWASSDPDVATVGSNGVVKGVRFGDADITVTTDNGISGVCRVKVLPEPTAISITPAKLELVEWRSSQLKYSFIPSNSATLSLTWESSDPDVATVSQHGLVRAWHPGHATVTLTTHRGIVGKCEITVLEPLYQLFVWTKAGIKTGYLSTDKPQFNVEGDIVHFSTKHLKMDIHRDTLDKFTLEPVLPEHPKYIIMPDIMTLPFGTSEQLSVTLSPLNSITSLTWFTDNPKVVSVTQDGLITALQPGEANIMVQSSNGLHRSCHITVPKPFLRFFVWLRDGEIHRYNLEERPEVSFGETVFTLTSSHQTVEYKAADILKFSLQDEFLVDGISMPKAIETDNVQLSEGMLLIANCPPHSPVQVYDTSARMIQTAKTDKNGNLSLSLALLQTGTYIIRTQTTTIKIQKR